MTHTYILTIQLLLSSCHLILGGGEEVEVLGDKGRNHLRLVKLLRMQGLSVLIFWHGSGHLAVLSRAASRAAVELMHMRKHR